MTAAAMTRTVRNPLNSAMHAIDTLVWALANAHDSVERLEIQAELDAANADFARVVEAL
jgi:hypothetical protein